VLPRIHRKEITIVNFTVKLPIAIQELTLTKDTITLSFDDLIEEKLYTDDSEPEIVTMIIALAGL
jgi:hypothetical protein